MRETKMATTMDLFIIVISIISLCSATFVEYGTSKGDMALGYGDDETHEVMTSEAIKIWDEDKQIFHISYNGAIFPKAYTLINPSHPWQILPDYSLYVYFADSKFDFECSNCDVYYRTNVSMSDMDKINALIHQNDPDFAVTRGKILVTTWFNGRAYHHPTTKNTFQSIVASNGSTTYAILSYDRLEYYTGLPSRLAKVGFKGSVNKFCNFPDSNADSIKLQCRSNVFVRGLFVVGLTPNANFQCDSSNNLEYSCSHCKGEQTWMTTACSNVTFSVCGSDGVIYRNKCELETEKCRRQDNISVSSMKNCQGTTSTPATTPESQPNTTVRSIPHTTVPQPKSTPVSQQYTTSVPQPKSTVGSHQNTSVSQPEPTPLKTISTKTYTATPQLKQTHSTQLYSTRTTDRIRISTTSIQTTQTIYTTPTASTTGMPPTTNTTNMTSGYMTFCDFENDTCGFVLGQNWKRNFGSTPTDSTGPNVDASGSATKYYIYFEASSAAQNTTYSITTRILNPTGNDTGCLRFAYHMYGFDMGTLAVKLSSQHNHNLHVWNVTGDQGIQWKNASISLGDILVEPFSPFNLTFVAISGSGYQSDMAVDNISVTYGADCEPGGTSPTPPANTTNTTSVLYPYGASHGDIRVPSGDDSTFTYSLSKPMKLFSKMNSKIYIGINGLVSFNRPVSNTRIPTADIVIALYNRDLDTRNRGNIYYRETTSPLVLNRTNLDVRKVGDAFFTATRAIIVSYILVARYGSTVGLHTFQVVIPTNGNTTYAILNYDRLDTTSATSGYSEGQCNYRLFTNFSNSGNLRLTSNVGRTGRHVYRLTNFNCFKQATGVFIAARSLRFSTLYGTTRVTLSLPRVTGDINFGAVLLELTSNIYHSTAYLIFTQVSTSSIILQVFFSNEYRTMFSNSLHSLQTVFVFSATPKTSVFQYDRVSLASFSTGINCQYTSFVDEMNSLPVIKISSDVGRLDNYQLRIATLWLHNVTTRGFDICYKEIMSFSGSKNISAHYVALAGPTHNFTEYGKVQFSMSSQLCQRIHLEFIYTTIPFVLTTPEEMRGSNTRGALISWIKQIGTNYVEICAKSSEDVGTKRKANISVHYIVQGAIDECSYFSCPNHLQCRMDRFNNPYCGCIQVCDNITSSKSLCGTDFVTYTSQCQLYKSHCEIFGNDSVSNVSIAHTGKCERFPYQAGKIMLDSIPEAQTVFCKNITLDENNFHPTSELYIQLSVSWTQNLTDNMTHPASASWSEQVSHTGFKACVMVAGRHFFNRFDKRPIVYWFAYQTGLSMANSSIELGVFNMSTWYTGSRCMVVPLKYADSNTQLFVSVEHTLRNIYENAMTAWIEESHVSIIKVCARELQNFDGIHEGIRLHWIAVHSTLPPFITENVGTNFSRKNYLPGSPIPAICTTLKYNKNFPALLNPTVLVSATIPITSSSSALSLFSTNDVTTWIEHAGRTHLKFCYKAIRNFQYSEQVRISYLVVPALCESGWSYMEGNCYKPVNGCRTQTDAQQQCRNLNASLPTVDGPAEAYYLEQVSQSNKTWIGLSDSEDEGSWIWNSGSNSSYRKWLPATPDGGVNENCAVVDGMSNVTGWNDVACSTCASVQCDKDADLEARTCFHQCFNGGTCVKQNKTNDATNSSYECVCPNGFVGKNCDIELALILECNNYTAHQDTWRIFDSSNNTSNISCDARTFEHGWHRFNASVGAQLSNNCTNSANKCGTKSPGWMNGTHPSSDDGIVRRYIRFYTHYCADDYGEVLVRNCGNFYTYQFVKFPSWSCDFGMCLKV